MTREERLLVVGLPVLIVLTLGGWVWWRQTADLDDIEKRQLDWAALQGSLIQHVVLSLVATALVLAIALPLGVLLTRRWARHLGPVVTGVANAGQAAPAIGLFVLLAIALGFGTPTAVLALTVYGVLPVLRNTIVGLQGIDQGLVEAARGMGMSVLGALLRIELPLAVPVILAGVRTALVLMVGTATFATFINAGGLGVLITSGITLFRMEVVLSGALLVAVLALVVEWAGRLLEVLTRPRGMS